MKQKLKRFIQSILIVLSVTIVPWLIGLAEYKYFGSEPQRDNIIYWVCGIIILILFTFVACAIIWIIDMIRKYINWINKGYWD